MLKSVVRFFSHLHINGSIPPSFITATCGHLAGYESCGLYPQVQQVRTTFVLRRKYEPRLYKTHKTHMSRRRRARDYVYELVEHTDALKRQPLQVLLLQSVQGVGLAGEVVEVSPQRARDDLLLPKLGVYASPGNLEKFKDIKSSLALDSMPSSRFALKTAKYLRGCRLSVSMNMENPWVVEPWHIRVALRKRGIMAPDYAIKLPEKPICGPDMDIERGEFVVIIKINNKEEVPVRCAIHHVPTDPKNSLPFKEKYWLHCGKVLFPEQAEIINELITSNPHMQVTDEDELDEDVM